MDRPVHRAAFLSILFSLPGRLGLDRCLGRGFQIHSRFYCQSRGFSFVFGDEVAVRVWLIAQFPQRPVIGDHETVESHLFAQDVAQEPLIGVRGDTVDFVVGRHHADGLGFFDYFLEWVEERFAENTFGNVRRRAVHAGLGLAVSGEVFQRGHYVFAVVEFSVALKTFYCGYAHAGDQVRIFTVSFFAASPTRVADSVYYRGQHMMSATDPGFFRGHGEQALDQCRVEAGC